MTKNMKSFRSLRYLRRHHNLTDEKGYLIFFVEKAESFSKLSGIQLMNGYYLFRLNCLRKYYSNNET